MAFNPAMKQSVAAVRERKKEVQKDLQAATAISKKAKEKLANANLPAGRFTESKEFQDARRAQDAVMPLEAELDRLKSEEMFLLQQASGFSAPVGGDSFLSDPDKMTELSGIAHSKAPIGSQHLGFAVTRDQYVFDRQQRKARLDADPTSMLDYEGAGRAGPVRPGVIPSMNRQLRLLDVIPTAPMDMESFPYVRQVVGYGTALETPELALKPEAAYDLEDAEVRASTIAHWMKLSRQNMADFAGLQAAIQNQLIFGVNDRVELQIVNGDGVGDNIEGILNITGVGDVEYDAGALKADAALDGLTEVMLSNAQPNGILLNPTDWAAMLKQKSTGSGEYMSMGPFMSTASALWDCPLIPSQAIAPGKALVGDWNRGAVLYVREGVNCRVSDSDQDDFLRNRLTILGEGRFGLAVYQPACFAVVNFTA